MIKLVRTTFARKQAIYGKDNNRTESRYLELLQRFSKDNDFYTHELNKKHLQWERNIMNVRIAVQTLSNSTANSIDFLRKENHVATVEFLKIFNTLFDIFNTQDRQNKNIFKQALNPENK